MKKSKSLVVKNEEEEMVKVKSPITGKTTDVVVRRDGTTDQKLAMVLLDPESSKEQKDSWLSNYFFERGKENASFLAELYVSKGTHLKETQAFKRQMRFDFESFANTIVLLFQDISDDIKNRIDTNFAWDNLRERLQKGAELLSKQREEITEARMREKGYGVYLDRNGQAYSIFDKEIVDVINKEREEISHEKETSKQASKKKVSKKNANKRGKKEAC